MRKPERAPRPATAILIPALLLSVLLTGCDGTGGIRTGGIKPVPPRDAREAMQRINDNLDGIQGALYCPGVVSFRFRDAEGHDRRFLFMDATVIFEAPRCLYFDIKNALAGTVARIGSNDEDYWLWIDTPETRKLWYGTWDALASGSARRSAVPPNQLLDALMMRSLADRMPGTSRPLLQIDGNLHRLVFLGLDDSGWPYAKREFVLDPKPPYMPLEVIDRLPDGRVVMHAYLKGYKPIKGSGSDGPYTPRNYVVYWELDQAEMRLDFSDVRPRTKDVPFCEFPEAWEGETESLDEPPAFEATDTAEEGTARP
jgi:hypothetical protein